MFQHDMRESKSNEINIQDIDFNTVRDMVKFIYSGRLRDLADKSDLLLAAADKYDIRDLKTLFRADKLRKAGHARLEPLDLLKGLASIQEICSARWNGLGDHRSHL